MSQEGQQEAKRPFLAEFWSCGSRWVISAEKTLKLSLFRFKEKKPSENEILNYNIIEISPHFKKMGKKASTHPFSGGSLIFNHGTKNPFFSYGLQNLKDSFNCSYITY